MCVSEYGQKKGEQQATVHDGGDGACDCARRRRNGEASHRKRWQGGLGRVLGHEIVGSGRAECMSMSRGWRWRCGCGRQAGRHMMARGIAVPVLCHCLGSARGGVCESPIARWRDNTGTVHVQPHSKSTLLPLPVPPFVVVLALAS